MATEKWSTLIIRVWVTDDGGQEFRARLVSLDGVSGHYETIALAADAVTVLDQARLWLEQFER